MEQILPGDRLKFRMRPRPTEYEPEELIFTVARVWEMGGYWGVESAAGLDYEEFSEGNMEIVARPQVPWIDGIEIEGVIDPIQLEIATELGLECMGYVDEVVQLKVGRIPNQWVVVDSERKDEPLRVPISEVIAGRIVKIPDALASTLAEYGPWNVDVLNSANRAPRA